MPLFSVNLGEFDLGRRADTSKQTGPRLHQIWTLRYMGRSSHIDSLPVTSIHGVHDVHDIHDRHDTLRQAPSTVTTW